MSRSSSAVVLLCLAALPLVAAEDPALLSEQAQRRAQALQLDIRAGEFADPERVRSAADVGIAQGRAELERRTSALRARTEVTVGLSDAGIQVPLRQESAGSEPSLLAGRLVVAISAGMPEGMVREYARQLDGVAEAVLVLRGFIGGARAVAPTVQWIERVLRRQPDNREGGHFRVDVVVDPLAYRMLGIAQVPAIAFLPGVQDLRHCDAEELRAAAITFGAVSVRGALEELGRTVAIPAELMRRVAGGA